MQLALHAVAWAGSPDPRMLVSHAVALLHDLFVLGGTLLLSSAVARLLLGRGRPTTRPSSAANSAAPTLNARGCGVSRA